jgi:small subunit ribosomal protein S6
MLDPEAPDAQRDKIVADARGRIQSSGEVKHDTAWGVRKMAYEIKQRNEADYRFFRFQGEPELLERLDHNLKITDGVLRFRIFKVDPESPASPPPAIERPMTVGDGRPDRDDRPRRGRRDE